MTKSELRSDALAEPIGVFSQAIVTPARGRFVFVSGLTARDHSGATTGVGDVRAQTTTILENLRHLLTEAGGSLEDVVRVTVYVTNLERDFAAIHDVRRQYFTKPYPASTLVEVSRLVSPDMLIEIEAIAVIDDALERRA